MAAATGDPACGPRDGDRGTGHDRRQNPQIGRDGFFDGAGGRPSIVITRPRRRLPTGSAGRREGTGFPKFLRSRERQAQSPALETSTRRFTASSSPDDGRVTLRPQRRPRSNFTNVDTERVEPASERARRIRHQRGRRQRHRDRRRARSLNGFGGNAQSCRIPISSRARCAARGAVRCTERDDRDRASGWDAKITCGTTIRSSRVRLAVAAVPTRRDADGFQRGLARRRPSAGPRPCGRTSRRRAHPRAERARGELGDSASRRRGVRSRVDLEAGRPRRRDGTAPGATARNGTRAANGSAPPDLLRAARVGGWQGHKRIVSP